ncbi:hypothetical protein FGO68_gene15479 [Halteria grandinella]|uniref:Uncharacterized protein n=1 Tax=Halteria grandinella TaxID=5974 RepID=A0A8J8T909_HALGN|nr:hypothetical protein FGO68_gene15479 [Halteria grandinella]
MRLMRNTISVFSNNITTTQSSLGYSSQRRKKQSVDIAPVVMQYQASKSQLNKYPAKLQEVAKPLHSKKQSDWGEMVRNDLVKNDQEILQTIKEKHESLRDVYDMRQYYIKRSVYGRNTTHALSPVNASPKNNPSPHLKNAFLPNTTRDQQFYKTLISFPDVTKPALPPPLCANLETLLQQRDLHIQALSLEMNLVKRENEQLTSLNRQLVHKVDTLSGFIEGEASGRQFYFEHPRKRNSGNIPEILGNHPGNLGNATGAANVTKATESTSKRKVEEMKRNLQTLYERQIGLLKRSFASEIETLHDLVSGLEAQLRDLLDQNTSIKQSFIDYSRQFEHMMQDSELARHDLQQQNQHLKETVSQLTQELRADRGKLGKYMEHKEFNDDDYQELLNEKNKLAKQLKYFESKFKNIDLDTLHSKNQLLQTKLDQTERESLHVSHVIDQLTQSIDKATKMYLKIRKQRELEWDLPAEEANKVDNRDWRKILEMEKKAFKIVEDIANQSAQAAKVGILKRGMMQNKPDTTILSDEDDDILAR